MAQRTKSLPNVKRLSRAVIDATTARDEAFVELSEKGWTVRDIAAKANMHFTVVARIIRKVKHDGVSELDPSAGSGDAA